MFVVITWKRTAGLSSISKAAISSPRVSAKRAGFLGILAHSVFLRVHMCAPLAPEIYCNTRSVFWEEITISANCFPE